MVEVTLHLNLILSGVLTHWTSYKVQIYVTHWAKAHNSVLAIKIIGANMCTTNITHIFNHFDKQQNNNGIVITNQPSN